MSKKSLVSDANLVPASVGGILDAMTETPAEVVSSASTKPYANFAHPKSKNWGEWFSQVPGLQEGDVLLIRPGQPPVRLNPFRFFFLTGMQAWVQSDINDGRILAASLTDPGKGSKLQENVETVILAFLPDGSLEPCRCTFRKAKAPAAKVAITAVAKAATPEWEKLTPAHAETLKLPKPWMRFTLLVNTSRHTSRNPDAAGSTYVLANGTAVPTSIADVKALKDFFERPDAGAMISAIREAYDTRLAEIRAVAGQ